jgi:hypothetical protein
MNMDYDRVLIVSCIICVTFTISFSKVHLFDFLVCLNVDIYVNDVDTFDCTGLRNTVAKSGMSVFFESWFLCLYQARSRASSNNVFSF